MGSQAKSIQQEIDRRFRYHEGTDAQCEDCIKVRASMQAAAHRGRRSHRTVVSVS
ncbi:hypothetical protein [Corynebacterium matruchotii]|nr:hypothetical protein [Corynebacterium matruchotii]